MNYDIYVANFSPDAIPEYAVEIRPPLSSVALEGLIKRLKSTADPRAIPTAADVTVVREDAEGVAFIITAASAHLSRDTQEVGKEVAGLLNPCKLDEPQVAVHLVEGHYGS